MQLYSPVGEVGQSTVQLADVPTVLAGRRIGILDNTKPNAAVLLRELADQLAARTGAVVTAYQSKNAATPCAEEVLQQMAADVDLVLTGSAD